MTPSLWFWIYAWIVLAAAIALAFVAWGAIRRGEVERHRALLGRAIGLIVLFVASYAAKLFFLGREDLSRWSTLDLWILRTHEVFIAAMLLAGGAARWLGRRRGSLVPAPGEPGVSNRRHRWLGRTAAVSGLLALVLGTFVLVGMFLRA